MFASNSGAEMDPHTARLLDDLKQLLREKVISLTEWRAEVAAIHERALAARPAPVAAANTEFDETMALIAREKARNERKPRARAIETPSPPAPVTAADADFDEIAAHVARERALIE